MPLFGCKPIRPEPDDFNTESAPVRKALGCKPEPIYLEMSEGISGSLVYSHASSGTLPSGAILCP